MTAHRNASAPKSAKIVEHSCRRTDPHLQRPVYPTINNVVAAIVAVICGADDFVTIAAFGRTPRRWFA